MKPRVRVERLEAEALRDRRDGLFYFTRLPAVAGLETLRFGPGAIADHLTSTGGVLTGPGMATLFQQVSSAVFVFVGKPLAAPFRAR